MAKPESEEVTQAKAIIRKRQVPPPDEALALAKKLLRQDQAGYARRVLAEVRRRPITDPDLRIRITEKYALATYKDTHRPRYRALEDALDILHRDADLETTQNQEVLGLAGAIHKRKWELDGRLNSLEAALRYYSRGYGQGIGRDAGYTAINAAYILDLLAVQETGGRTAVNPPSEEGVGEIAERRREQARALRTVVTKTLSGMPEPDADPEQIWWFRVTLAEAYFGLGRYPEAQEWLLKAKALEFVPDWQYETCLRQLARLARLQAPATGEREDSEAWRVLDMFCDGNSDAVRTAFLGRVGLALSGGGFRASFFHIGVLARLAELDLLRHVEVLSCVSGGSIVGAHYYLALRGLYHSSGKDGTQRVDGDITRDDYVALVRRLAGDFLAGVQKNLRMRIAANPWANLKMLFFPNYTRTERLGDLYETHLYKEARPGGCDRRIWLNDLFITPADGPEDFKPRRDNWKRRNKVPTLILNATTLNTGHNWQFTASWMGESPNGIDPDVDGNPRLRRMYYHEAPARYRRVRLGHAVAASSCVPGLFEPLALPRLFESEKEGRKVPYTVRLVDGGVHDNQGIAGLLEQDCDVLLVSDASGQMNAEPDPGGGSLRPLLRTNSVLMARLRDAEYQDIVARRRAGLLKGLFHVHLKKELEVRPLDWIDCREPPEEPPAPNTTITGYGILKDIQELLAGIRTDLDSFTDLEAHALMASGYRMAGHYLNDLPEFPRSRRPPEKWPFLDVEAVMTDPGHPHHGRFKRLLKTGSHLFFKVWLLSPPLLVAAAATGLAAVGGLGWFWVTHGDQSLKQWLPDATVGETLTWAAVTLVSLVVGKWLVNLWQYRQTFGRILTALGMGMAGWAIAGLHLAIFDRLYLYLGRTKPED